MTISFLDGSIQRNGLIFANIPEAVAAGEEEEEEPFGEALAEYSMDLVEFGLFATEARCCTPAG